VAGEDPLAEGVGLALPDDSHPGALEAEVEPADPGEQGPDPHVTPATSGSASS
jgi:hypothetical protein